MRAKTKVIFKIAHYAGTSREEDEVVAFFPGAPANPGNVMSYAHVGQHGEASYDFYLNACRPCPPERYAGLKRELETCFGYDLEVVRRISKKDREEAWKR